jgi:hypothetical protein
MKVQGEILRRGRRPVGGGRGTRDHNGVYDQSMSHTRMKISRLTHYFVQLICTDKNYPKRQ